MKNDKPDDRLTVRDGGLKKRITVLVGQSNGEWTVADLMRAALEEYVSRAEKTGELVRRVHLRPEP